MVNYLKERYHLVIDAESGRQGKPEEPITVYQIETANSSTANEKAETRTRAQLHEDELAAQENFIDPNSRTLMQGGAIQEQMMKQPAISPEFSAPVPGHQHLHP